MLYLALSQGTDSQLTILSFLRPGKGLDQGCPLSSDLFALTLEPLAIQLHAADSVTEFEVGGTEEKMYADDTLLYFTDTSSSHRTALQIIIMFSTVSGIRVNVRLPEAR